MNRPRGIRRTRTSAVAIQVGAAKSAAQQTPVPNEPERFVDAVVAAEFLALRPRRVLELARSGFIPAYPIGEGQRRVWRFRLSELATAIQTRLHFTRQSPAPDEER